MSLTREDLPRELKNLYDALYSKIESIVSTDVVIDIKNDPKYIKVIISSSMEIVEKFKNKNGKGWSGEDKKKHALSLIKLVIKELERDGKLEENVADEIIENIDFWGDLVIDIVIDVAKKVFDVGQEFAEDVSEKGCKIACKENCIVM